MDLQQFFKAAPRAAAAFSGGADSAYLLYAAKTAGADIAAYFVKTEFQPEFEYRDALRLAGELDIKLKVLELDILSLDDVRKNPANRCYYCKRAIFSAIAAAARSDGYDLVIDGTNASDDADDRPGMRALAELSVRSPLRECGLTKEEIRRLSSEAGLFTWNKPAYACLATRIPEEREITKDMLERIEAAEKELAALGFSDFRCRIYGSAARLQIKKDQFPAAARLRTDIINRLKPYFNDIFLDLNIR